MRSNVVAFVSPLSSSHAPSSVPRRRWSDTDSTFMAAVQNLRRIQREQPAVYLELLSLLALAAQ